MIPSHYLQVQHSGKHRGLVVTHHLSNFNSFDFVNSTYYIKVENITLTDYPEANPSLATYFVTSNWTPENYVLETFDERQTSTVIRQFHHNFHQNSAIHLVTSPSPTLILKVVPAMQTRARRAFRKLHLTYTLYLFKA